jgi:predicted DCC family thiol-disulfide oxidoreductase YuxK
MREATEGLPFFVFFSAKIRDRSNPLVFPPFTPARQPHRSPLRFRMTTSVTLIRSAHHAYRYRTDPSFPDAQTPLGAALYAHFDLAPHDYESNILIEDGLVRTKSDGSIRIFELLGFPWSLLTVGRLLPRGVRDRLYTRIARNRQRWFGKRDACYLPDPSEREWFLG